MKRNYQICKRCVMDTSYPDIEFDENGICNYCTKYEIINEKIEPISVRKVKLEKLVTKIKKDGKEKKYNCIIGVSGGVDSSYVVYIAWKYNLKPLIVHVDNGWDSEEAIENIKNIISKTGFDLFTYKLDWEEFKDLQRSYFKASVIDIEVLTDHGIKGFIHKLAYRKGKNYILEGVNISTEGLVGSESASIKKTDVKNIKSIHKLFGRKKIKKFPFVSTLQYLWNEKFTKKIKYIRILDYIMYNKAEAKKILKEKFSFKDYGLKHYESIFTRFYQGYILINKFGIDKRRLHLSNLICSKQMSREEALKKLKEDPYPPGLLKKDKKYVLDKLDFSNEEFENLMKEKPKSHYEYPNEKTIVKCVTIIGRIIKPFIKY